MKQPVSESILFLLKFEVTQSISFLVCFFLNDKRYISRPPPQKVLVWNHLNNFTGQERKELEKGSWNINGERQNWAHEQKQKNVDSTHKRPSSPVIAVLILESTMEFLSSASPGFKARVTHAIRLPVFSTDLLPLCPSCPPHSANSDCSPKS